MVDFVIGVDVSMNIYLKMVKMIFKGKNLVIMDYLSLRGNNICYYIFFDSLNFEILFVEDIFCFKFKKFVVGIYNND